MKRTYRKITQREAAKRIGISEVWLSTILNRRTKKPVSVDMALRIEQAFEGQVKAIDLIPSLAELVKGLE